MYVRSFECSFFFSLKHGAPGSVVVQIICVIWGWCSEWFSQFLICVFLVFFCRISSLAGASANASTGVGAGNGADVVDNV